MKRTSFLSVLSTFILCYISWMLFTMSFTFQELLAGAVVSLMVALFSARFLIHENAMYLFNPIRLVNFFLYLIVFVKELWKANVDVARRALNPRLPINPGIVKVETGMKSEYGIAMLANSITLTPGTITLDVVEENGRNFFYIHWIDVATTDIKEAGEAIKSTLEKGVAGIWK